MAAKNDRMIKDFFGITTDRIDIVDDFQGLLKYRAPPKQTVSNLQVQRMYLEDDQKEQLASSLGIDTECDFLELDFDVILKYAALRNSSLLYIAPDKRA